ncbi:co-chaperone YbbN [Glycomyces buryatensis]|uniref:Tetratricopeptide repeat protein n=1 Tax=Glycomyces buryatensis TaxID=2570927 RepID=A0A4S8QFY6_9ACTN|nr:tetratricopeptide repeat protein [Glycomyces buryatensis]THV39554.1 tetratricopeptide repeat protein [Glycomyces buryatensis]
MNDQVPSRFSGGVDLSALAAQQQQQQPAPSQAPAAPGLPGAGGPGVVSIDVTDATVQSEVLERSLESLVIVVFWADQVPESLQTRDLLQQLAQAAGGAWMLAKADVQQNQQLAAALQLQALPAVVALAQGRPVDLVQGPQNESGLRQFINKVVQAVGLDVPQQVDPELAAAENHLMEGELDAAEAAYDKYLKNHPASIEAEAGLAQVKLIRRAGVLPENAAALADAAPDDIDAGLAAADLEMLSGLAENAYDRLIKLVAGHFGEERERVRKRLVELFLIAGADDPAVAKARRKLSSVLF